jgi:hypothetical protein
LIGKRVWQNKTVTSTTDPQDQHLLLLPTLLTTQHLIIVVICMYLRILSLLIRLHSCVLPRPTVERFGIFWRKLRTISAMKLLRSWRPNRLILASLAIRTITSIGKVESSWKKSPWFPFFDPGSEWSIACWNYYPKHKSIILACTKPWEMHVPYSITIDCRKCAFRMWHTYSMPSLLLPLLYSVSWAFSKR